MNKKIVSIHQPQYLPWVPYFNKILRSDEHIVLDNVQFQKNGVQNRNQIKTSQGAAWLTVPVRHRFGQLINETEVADEKTLAKHLRSIEVNYRRSRYFAEVFDLFQRVLDQPCALLVQVNNNCVGAVLDYFGYGGKIREASSLGVEGKGSELILNICKAVGATTYLSGPGGRNYLHLDEFQAQGILVVFQEYHPVEYQQLFPERGFIKDLSVIDLLFNLGPESLEFVGRGRCV